MSDSPADIDPHNNVESRALEENQSRAVSRGGMSGMTAMGAPEVAAAELDGDGTASGNPVAGVSIDDADRAQAVDGDTGPEHPGTHGSTGGA